MIAEVREVTREQITHNTKLAVAFERFSESKRAKLLVVNRLLA